MAARSLESLMDNLGESFTTRLLQLSDERGLKDSTVYKQSNISRQHFSKIQCNREYNPRLFRHVFTPILDRYGVLPQDRPYIMAFHAVLLASPPPGEWYNFLTSTSPCFTGFETL